MEKNEDFKEELETQYTILIKAKEKKEHQRFIVLLIILGITFVSVIISVIFSYKALSATKKLDKNESVSSTYYKTLSITFNGNQNLNLTGIGNGYELTNPKVIQITNEGDSDITFDIKLVSIQSSLLSTNNLVYTISCNNETSITKELPLSDKIIVSDITITPEETKTYVIKVAFKGTIEEGNYNNYYNSKIVVEANDNKTSLLE
ncbi:MAG: hypothetical protein ACI4XM_03415 [Candidatus Coprovivens sp.]